MTRVERNGRVFEYAVYGSGRCHGTLFEVKPDPTQPGRDVHHILMSTDVGDSHQVQAWLAGRIDEIEPPVEGQNDA